MARIGLISDTHGLLRPEAIAFLRGCDRIVHGGDIGHQGILSQLSELAPLTAVRGNNDRDPWAEAIPEMALLNVGEISLYAVHDLAQLDLEPSAAGVHVVVSGHSHKPLIERRDGVLYINPGSAGPRRFKLPISVAEVITHGRSVSARLVELGVTVQDAAGHGLEGIVVIAEPDAPSGDHGAVRTAIMDQKHMQFVPDILVVQTGSSVDFPNSDQIRHQVYSFSPAKTFELSL